ncbi:DUF2993 domain-containing protein [Planococcus sp. APC 4015]|nr:DUF2993 domain-containing protein [Planococcus sp. APC 4015]
MATGDTQPTLPLPDGLVATEQPRRPRRAWPWLVAFGIVVLLAVGAWFLGEMIARDLVEKTIRTQITSNLPVPADQEIDVDVPGAIIPQLIGGRLDEVRVAADDIAIDAFAGDIAVEMRDVPIRGGAVSDASATVTLDEAQLRRLMAQVDGFPSDALGIDSSFVTASMELSLFGASIPIGFSLTPSADEGELVLTPESLQVAGADVTVDELRRQFGVLSNAVLRDWPVCVAQYLPAGLALDTVDVVGDDLVARFSIADTILTDPALRTRGTC